MRRASKQAKAGILRGTAPAAMLDCGHAPSKHSSYTTGYGTNQAGQTQCYACCAAAERASMLATGRAVLYLTWDDVLARYVITDWPGMLRFTASRHSQGRHNMARVQQHVWFTGPDGQPWHGVTYSDNTQLCHCRRVAGKQAQAGTKQATVINRYVCRRCGKWRMPATAVPPTPCLHCGSRSMPVDRQPNQQAGA